MITPLGPFRPGGRRTSYPPATRERLRCTPIANMPTAREVAAWCPPADPCCACLGDKRRASWCCGRMLPGSLRPYRWAAPRQGHSPPLRCGCRSARASLRGSLDGSPRLSGVTGREPGELAAPSRRPRLPTPRQSARGEDGHEQTRETTPGPERPPA